MILDSMTISETTKEVAPAIAKISTSAQNIFHRAWEKPMTEKEKVTVHSLTVRGTKYYYFLRIRRLSNKYRDFHILAAFTILRHEKDGRRYFLQICPTNSNTFVYKSYEFHFCKRYAERKQGENIRWAEEDFIKVFQTFILEHCFDPSTIYLIGKNGKDTYNFMEKSSAGMLLGLFHDWPEGVWIRYKTFVCGEDARELQKQFSDTIAYDAWAKKVTLGEMAHLAVVNCIDDKDDVKYLY